MEAKILAARWSSHVRSPENTAVWFMTPNPAISALLSRCQTSYGLQSAVIMRSFYRDVCSNEARLQRRRIFMTRMARRVIRIRRDSKESDLGTERDLRADQLLAANQYGRFLIGSYTFLKREGATQKCSLFALIRVKKLVSVSCPQERGTTARFFY